MKDTRSRVIDASSTLFRRQGYAATGLKQIAADAPAPFGSIYHFFPGGKQQLAEEVIRSAGPWYGALVYDFFTGSSAEARDLPGVLTALFDSAAADLERSDYADACPIATVALEVAGTNEVLRRATADVFTEWIDAGSRLLSSRGLDAHQSRTLVLMLISTLEGAFVLSRSLRSIEPLHAAGAGLAGLAASMTA